MSDKIFLRLKILSETKTPDDVSALLGLDCNKSWLKSERNPYTVFVGSVNGWIINSGIPPEMPLGDHCDALWAMVEPVREVIHALSEVDFVEVSLAVYSEKVPALRFSKKHLRDWSSIGAGLDIDLYPDLGDEE